MTELDLMSLKFELEAIKKDPLRSGHTGNEALYKFSRMAELNIRLLDMILSEERPTESRCLSA